MDKKPARGFEGKQISEYVHETYGDEPWDRQTKMSEAGKGTVNRTTNWRKYYQNKPTKWKRPKDWPPNSANDK